MSGKAAALFERLDTIGRFIENVLLVGLMQETTETFFTRPSPVAFGRVKQSHTGRVHDINNLLAHSF